MSKVIIALEERSVYYGALVSANTGPRVSLLMILTRISITGMSVILVFWVPRQKKAHKEIHSVFFSKKPDYAMNSMAS